MLRQVFTMERGEEEGHAPPERPRTQRTPLNILAGAVVVLSSGYLLLFWLLDALPFQDLPNHLARATIEADLLLNDGRRFGSMFAVDLRLWPYVGGDVALAAFVAAFGPDVAGRLWVIAVAASLPLSLAVYLRTTGHSAYGVLLSVPLSLYLTTDWAFLSGLHHYRLGLAFVVLALAGGQAWLRSGSVRAYVAWAVLLVVSYLLHLSALVLGAVGAAGIALVSLVMRTTTWRRVVAGTLPWWCSPSGKRATPAGRATGDWGWGGLRKVARLVSPYYRYDWPPTRRCSCCSWPSACSCSCAERCSIGPALRDRRGAGAGVPRHLRGAAVRERPRVLHRQPRVAARRGLRAGRVARGGGARSAPERAHGRAHPRARGGQPGGDSAPLIRHNAVMRRYRSVAAEIPAGARVLPVATAPPVGHVDLYLHAGAFATLEAGAMTPYLFSGGPHRFFRYLAPPKGVVDEFWYQGGTALDSVTRSAIVDQFDYLLVKKPYDPGRLPLPTEEVGGSEVVALLKIIR
jgi:hypothetical protein